MLMLHARLRMRWEKLRLPSSSNTTEADGRVQNTLALDSGGQVLILARAPAAAGPGAILGLSGPQFLVWKMSENQMSCTAVLENANVHLGISLKYGF